MSLNLCAVCGHMLGRLESDVHNACRATEAPNLDSLDEYDLQEFIDKIASYGFPQFTSELLVQYARRKLLAIEDRKAGNIDSASLFERMCDSIYRRLPKQFRW